MSLIRKHVAVLQAWACLALVKVFYRVQKRRDIHCNTQEDHFVHYSLCHVVLCWVNVWSQNSKITVKIFSKIWSALSCTTNKKPRKLKIGLFEVFKWFLTCFWTDFCFWFSTILIRNEIIPRCLYLRLAVQLVDDSISHGLELFRLIHITKQKKQWL